ncbi:MAG TPA: ATP-binding protein [Anaeromyxobacteraceae bacterium]|nr:ATP-binding protein [Anaeromyxobacteraceae bacterium]
MRFSFRLQIAAALVVAAVVPLAAALWLASRLAEENLALGLNPRLIEELQETPALYGDLFRARKELYAEQARTLAAELPGDPERAGRYLEAAVRRVPRLRRASFIAPDGAVLAEAEAEGPNPEGEWRAAQARAVLPSGEVLQCVFAIEARFFADLAEARELAQSYLGAGRLRRDIQKSYVAAFGALVALFAAAAAGAGLLLARRTTRRIADLMGAVRELARGNLAVQVEAGSGRDEVAGLARAFNAMVREVREGRDRIVYLEKISGWQEVARRLAHEIKNPLTPIQLAFQQLETRFRASPAAADPELGRLVSEASLVVREEIATLERLVGEFSAFARLPDVRPEPAELGAFVEEFLRSSPQVAGAADVDLRREGDCPVFLDRTLMRQVLGNLLRNAEEAARPARARVHLAVRPAGAQALLTVADQGPGIPPELRARVFDPYFTTRRDGTGLGLAIVRKIVLQHGGDVEARQPAGGGALLAVTLPLAPPGGPPPRGS